MSSTLASADSASYVDNWTAAREAKEQQRRNPYGFLAYAGFNKFIEAPARFAGLPGSWSTGPAGPFVRLADGEELLVDGHVVTGERQFAPVAEREFRRAAQAGEVILELSKRGGQDLLRPIDSAFGRTRVDAFDHTPAYDPDPQGRSLQIEFPAEAGPLTLDFNYTQNLQRPYTAFAPCPLPPARNTVTVAVEAGEQLPVFNR